MRKPPWESGGSVTLRGQPSPPRTSGRCGASALLQNQPRKEKGPVVGDDRPWGHSHQTRDLLGDRKSLAAGQPRRSFVAGIYRRWGKPAKGSSSLPAGRFDESPPARHRRKSPQGLPRPQGLTTPTITGENRPRAGVSSRWQRRPFADFRQTGSAYDTPLVKHFVQLIFSGSRLRGRVIRVRIASTAC